MSNNRSLYKNLKRIKSKLKSILAIKGFVEGEVRLCVENALSSIDFGIIRLRKERKEEEGSENIDL